MLISFDLDDTLICHDLQVPREPLRAPGWKRFQVQEPLRLGTVDLAQNLQNDGHQLMIYTTSLRKPSQVKRWLGFYGFRASEVINADLHARKVGQMARQYSKLPSYFGVSLHVDDENFCAMGDRFGFKWLMIEPRDLGWTDKVLAAVREIETQKP